MAQLRVFVSSTCYDLTVLRNQLRSFIESQGHEPVMSDYNDVLYDPTQHTHSSCIDEVSSCDVVVVIIGSRYGGKSVPEAIDRVDFESLEKSSGSVEILKAKENISITQLEVLKAIELSIPVFTFVEDRVWHDHATFEKNKLKSIIEEIEFSSIEKPKTARYIFEFINFIRHRNSNNAVTPFSRYTDLEASLSQQWSFLFKKLLAEQRNRASESRRIDALTEKFEDLKNAMLSTIDDDARRKVARGVIRYRRLYDFFNAIIQYAGPITQFGTEEVWTWQRLLDALKVVDIGTISREAWSAIGHDIVGSRLTNVLVRSDGELYGLYFPLKLASLKEDFEEFMTIDFNNRRIILEALSESGSLPRRLFVHSREKDIEKFLDSLRTKEGGLDMGIGKTTN